MIVKVNKSVNTLINKALLNQSFLKMNKPHKYFIVSTLLFFACIKGRINFLQLERFIKFCEQYFRIGFQKKFDFLSFNTTFIKERLSGDLAIAMDPSYISTYGRYTAVVGNFRSGFASKAKWGLELCSFAPVDIMADTAYYLKAYQALVPKN